MNGSNEAGHYRVLARKYRPTDFSGLIGQEAMVRTLVNAIAQGRLAHAFMLTGVRGVGKTTTARILARVFNCEKGPTATPCGACDHCLSIAEDRHVDVIEMDAASRTGIDDIRELIEGIRYRPVSARFKVYIIDEVHMLSKQAFNALLKTLEEPPAHVKFIFATTEIGRVPVTVLSRCQRFDLRRIETETLAAHFAKIAALEKIEAEPLALTLIAKAADGSARDGLSLLDQAIAMAEGKVTETQVREMLGLSDRTRIFDLFAALMAGDAAKSLNLLGEMYRDGADPIVVMQDLLELTHFLTRAKISPVLLDQPIVPEAERRLGGELAGKLSLPVLARTWQMLLKGLAEAQAAPNPLQAVEMAFIRLMHVSDRPTPNEILRRLTNPGTASASSDIQTNAGGERRNNGGNAGMTGGGKTGGDGAATARAPRLLPEQPLPEQAPLASATPDTIPLASNPHSPNPHSFEDVVALFREKREGILLAHLLSDVHLVSFEPGRMEFRPGPRAPANLANRLASCLGEWTGARWLVSLSADTGRPSLKEQAQAALAEEKRQAAEHPLVKAVLDAFPGAIIEAVRQMEEPAPIASGTEDAAPDGAETDAREERA
jgi:DNA polymerase III subunit gamma/tau